MPKLTADYIASSNRYEIAIHDDDGLLTRGIFICIDKVDDGDCDYSQRVLETLIEYLDEARHATR